MEINEKLKVSDGMSAWIKDFQESDAPQFKDKSEKERREMAIAAYMSAKKGDMSESSLRKSIAQISSSFPERSRVKTKDGKSGTVLTVGADFVTVAHGNKMKDYKPSELTKESVDLDENPDEAFTDKEIKMAYGILNDPRYKSGNLTKAVNKIEQIKKGLSKHPGVQKAMKATTESVKVSDLSVKENFEDQKHEMALTQAHFIQYAAEEIIEYIKMGGVIEEWYQNKLSKAHSDMESLHSHMEGIKRKNVMGESILPDGKESIVESTGAKFNNAMKQTMGAYDKRDLVKADRYLEKARQYLFSMRSTEYGKIDDKSYEQYKKLMKELRNKKIGESSIKEGKGGSGKRLSFVKDQGDNHIVMQLRSAQDLGGMKPIKFRGGKEGQVPKADIDTVLKVHDMLSPEGKRKLRIMISKSPTDFSKAAADLRKAMK